LEVVVSWPRASTIDTTDGISCNANAADGNTDGIGAVNGGRSNSSDAGVDAAASNTLPVVVLVQVTQSVVVVDPV
jgi:hypothetical protein